MLHCTGTGMPEAMTGPVHLTGNSRGACRGVSVMRPRGLFRLRSGMQRFQKRAPDVMFAGRLVNRRVMCNTVRWLSIAMARQMHSCASTPLTTPAAEWLLVTAHVEISQTVPVMNSAVHECPDRRNPNMTIGPRLIKIQACLRSLCTHKAHDGALLSAALHDTLYILVVWGKHDALAQLQRRCAGWCHTLSRKDTRQGIHTS